MPSTLQAMTGVVSADRACSGLSGVFSRSFTSATMLCVKGSRANVGPGDSGGPLLRSTAAGWVQVGVTSIGHLSATRAYAGYASLQVEKAWVQNRAKVFLDCDRFDHSRGRSVSGTTPSEIDWTNKSNRTVKLYWLNYSGTPRYYASLAPNSSLRQRTYLDHAWLVQDGFENCYGYTVSDKRLKAYTIY